MEAIDEGVASDGSSCGIRYVKLRPQPARLHLQAQPLDARVDLGAARIEQHRQRAAAAAVGGQRGALRCSASGSSALS